MTLLEIFSIMLGGLLVLYVYISSSRNRIIVSAHHIIVICALIVIEGEFRHVLIKQWLVLFH